MTPLVPLLMFGWPLLGLYLYSTKEPRDAAVLLTVGGVLFLPMYSFPMPFIIEYHKMVAISVALVLGHLVSGKGHLFPLRLSGLDLPILVWCFVSPLATSLSNGLGLYDGASNVARNMLGWGVYYWIGRKYFNDAASLRKLTLALVVGGLIYFPLMAFEVRMSPQLSRIFYGFFPHSFLQHFRYGGFRPIVFMQHGLMVALWSGASAIAAFALWQSGQIKRVKGIPIVLAVAVMILGTFICKSVGAFILMIAGIGAAFVLTKSKSSLPIKAMLLVAMIYIIVRVENIVPITEIEEFLERYFDPERVQSAFLRLEEEDIFGARSLQRPIFGWGGFRRGWPIDPYTGEPLIGVIDALWTILFNTFGFTGLISGFGTLGIGAWMTIRNRNKLKKARPDLWETLPPDGMILSLIAALFILDCLQNAMHNPFYILSAGALVTHALNLDPRRLREAALRLPIEAESAHASGGE